MVVRTLRWRSTKEDCSDSLSENEDKDHSDENPRLLSDSANTSITDDSDGETGGKTGETDGKTGTELDETGVEGHGGLELAGDEDRDDEAVNLEEQREEVSASPLCAVSSSSLQQKEEEGREKRGEQRTAMIPAMTTGMIHFIIKSGRRTPIAAIPTPDLEVP
jgi:hypothetical protein